MNKYSNNLKSNLTLSILLFAVAIYAIIKLLSYFFIFLLILFSVSIIVMAVLGYVFKWDHDETQGEQRVGMFTRYTRNNPFFNKKR